MTDTSITVREATAKDIDRLVVWNMAMALETEGLKLDEAQLRAGVREVFDNPARGFYLVAETAGQAAGSLMITCEWSDWRNGDWWWIQSVYVDPAHRRRGVYRALHEHVVRLARAAGNVRGLRLYVERGNAGAQQTYLALGMDRAHYEMFEVEFPPGGDAQ